MRVSKWILQVLSDTRINPLPEFACEADSPSGESGSGLMATTGGLPFLETLEPRLGALRLPVLLDRPTGLDAAAVPDDGSMFSLVSSKDTCVAATYRKIRNRF